MLRTIEPARGLPPHIFNLIARPPFAPEQEREVLKHHRISHLVTKNAGGLDTAKLDAADLLRLTTIVVDRPPVPTGPVAVTPHDAVAWLRETVAIAQ